MKALTLTLVITFLSLCGFSQNFNSYTTYRSTSISSTNSNVRVQSGYIKTDGTYVQPHFKTQPNSTNHDNFSTTPNTNPYTGQSGTRARDYSTESLNY